MVTDRRASRLARCGGYVDVRSDVEHRFNEQVAAELEQTIWTRCDSYYRSPIGRIVTQWPHSKLDYARATWRLRRRDYPESLVKEIKLLRSMQALGFSLTEIRQVLDGLRSSDIDCLDGARLLADKRQRIEEQIRDLREVSRTLRQEQKRLEGRAHRHGKQFD